MNRLEFIESCKNLTEEDLREIAVKQRERAESRITPEVKALFRSLDDRTKVSELYFDTSWGKTHVYMVRAKGSLQEKMPVLVNVHGGGWSLDHTERDIFFSRRLALRTGCLVADVDYVLAPEHPYPAALEEIEALLDCLPELCGPFSGDMDRVILCGQSAGGNLLGAVSQRGRVKARYRTLAQILCYMPADNYNDHFNGEELDDRGMSTEYYGFFYNRVFEERANHDVSLALSSVEELKDLPATDIITAGLDNLKLEADRYYALLQQAGIPVSYRCFENSRHGFLVNIYDEWKEGEEYVAERIMKHLSNL